MNFGNSLVLIFFAGLLAAGPVRASVDVSAFGAVGDGRADDTMAIQNAINSLPVGDTLTFGGPNQIFLISARLVFLPNRTYQGQGTLRMKPGVAAHTAIAKMNYDAADRVTITGLTFDASGVGGGLQISVDGGSTVPANGVKIDRVSFRNTIGFPSGAWDGAIYAPVGLINSQITNNQINNCAYGIYVANPNVLTVSNNFFQAIHYGNAVSIVFNPAPFAYGQGIQISENSGQHLGRMGIEVWPSGGNIAQTSPIGGIVISDNTFSDWDPGYTTDTFGISVMAGRQNVISSNKLVGPNGGFGIELGAPESKVMQNAVSGFRTGVVLHDSFNSTVSGNLLASQTHDGIEFSNAPGSRNGVVVQNNSIINPQVFGIFANTPDWGGVTISGNFISRLDGAFSADQAQSFTGIATTPPSAPVTVTGNSITQAGTNGPSGFSFIGIRLNGGASANRSSKYQNNTVLSQSMLVQSFGIFGNSTGALDGAVIQGNTFSGLYSASGGAASTGALSSGNLVYNCTLVGPIGLMP